MCAKSLTIARTSIDIFARVIRLQRGGAAEHILGVRLTQTNIAAT